MSLLKYSPVLSSPPSQTSSPANHHAVVVAPFALYPSSDVPKHSHIPWQHLYVLPVLLLEFLAIALTRAVMPSLLLEKYGDHVYLVMGTADCIRGLLAFLACPLFGKLSDITGRRVCLFVTVLGTCAPICSLAFFTWDDDSSVVSEENAMDQDDGGVWTMIVDATGATTTSETISNAVHPHAISVFVVLLALSGVFSSTFTLVFAYISDTVTKQEDRVSAYGLALATFGLSFTIGPMAGGYLAQYNKQYVFLTSLILTVVDLLYIYLVLPESVQLQEPSGSASRSTLSLKMLDQHNFSWNPWDTLRLISTDPFLRKVGQVAFWYYTGLWAIISTLSVYAVQRFHLSPERLGELMSTLGLCTMVAEAVLVRIMVPLLGERRAIKLGLVSFALQCIVLGFAYEGWHLFLCAAFSLLGNLVYPSLTSLVSGSVEPDAIGEALGAVNGIKALTEGIGPLVFGSLMTLSERSALPGWPYLLASVLAVVAYKAADELPDDDDEEDYIHELERKRLPEQGILMRTFAKRRADEEEEEYEGLLSEIDEETEGEDTLSAN
jgi:DHA1 family tetracycline resistance protein-like MFS transporter